MIVQKIIAVKHGDKPPTEDAIFIGTHLQVESRKSRSKYSFFPDFFVTHTIERYDYYEVQYEYSSGLRGRSFGRVPQEEALD